MITVTQDVTYDRGKPVVVSGVRVAGKRLVLERRVVTIARLSDEWYDGIVDPEAIVQGLLQCMPRPDIFTFWQRLPDLVPMYEYHHESEALSAIPLSSFGHWWNNQISSDTRKKAKRPGKRGIEIRVVPLTDDFVRGVMAIYNETPVRRGRPFWHFGHDFETVQGGLLRDLNVSKFIGAYERNSLVGFVKLVFAPGRFANPGLILSRLDARKKYVNNGLIAKAVELCVEAPVPYLTYTNWRRGTQAEFLTRHGFQRKEVPRYWIPLTTKGRLAIKLGLHRNIRTYLPESVIMSLRAVRQAFYSRRYGGTAVLPGASSSEHF